MPKDLNNCVVKYLKDSAENIYDRQFRTHTVNTLNGKWQSIIKLIRIQVSGIHKISSDVAKDFKKKWMHKFNITSEKKKKIRRDKLIDLELEEDASVDNQHEGLLDNIKIEPEISQTKRKACNGIRCKFANQIWESNKKIGKKRIKMNERVCQNYSKLSTAFRKAYTIGTWLIEEDANIKEDIISRNTFLKNMCENKKLYMLGEILEKYILSSSGNALVQLKGKNGKITDSTRLILRILGQALGFQTPPIFSISFLNSNEETDTPNKYKSQDWTVERWGKLKESLPKWEELLENNTVIRNNIYNKKKVRDIEDEETEPELLHTVKGEKNMDLAENTKYTTVCKKTKRHPNSSNLLKTNNYKRIKKLHHSNKYQIALEQIVSVGELLSSDYVDIMLDAIRRNSGNQTYIAGAYTSSLMALESDNTIWRPLGRLFRDNRARDKEDGVYIIPSFTGSINSGHWLVNAVWWEGNEGKGFTLDSLGCGGREKDIIRHRIESSFGGNKIVAWNEIQCIRQLENECGPRMLAAIETISTDVNSLKEFEALVLEAANLFELRNNGENRSLSEIVRGEMRDYLNYHIGNVPLTKG